MNRKKLIRIVPPANCNTKRKAKIESSNSSPELLNELSFHKKGELIKKFQLLEGSLDCFASPYGKVCNQFICLWRNECIAQNVHGENHE